MGVGNKDGSLSGLTEREHRIIETADALLEWCEKQLQPHTEAWIDSQFLFRFDPVWSARVSDVQKDMCRLLRGPSGEPLSEWDGIRWFLHLQDNFGFGSDDSSWEIPNPYRALMPARMHYAEHAGWPEWRIEALESLRIREKLWRLAVEFNLLPDMQAAKDWSPREIEYQFQRVTAWVIFDRGVFEEKPPPTDRPRHYAGEVVTEDGIQFRIGRGIPAIDSLYPSKWQAVVLVEEEIGGGIMRILPRDWDPIVYDDGPDTTIGKGRRISRRNRVLSWTLYYLSKRGGGQRSVEAAVDLWETIRPDPAGRTMDYSNWRKVIDKLFEKGSKIR